MSFPTATANHPEEAALVHAKMVLSIVGVSFITASVPADNTSVTTTSAVETAMFRGGPEHLGVYTSSSSPDLKTTLWKHKTGGRVVSSPAVAGDAVYFGSSDGHVYGVNRTDGALRWKLETGGPVNSSPAFRDGVVYAGSIDGKFYAVDASTGKTKWTFATQGERRFTAPGIHGAIPRTELMADPFDVFLSSPVLAGEIVYFGSGDNNVYALDVASGALKWKFKTGDVVHATPAVANGIVYIGSWDRYMYALNAATGKEIWRFQTGNDTTIYNQIGIASSAAIANGIVLFGCRDGHFYAVDAKTGAQRWKHDNKMGWVIASPAVKDGVVYFPTSDGTRFKAIDIATGALKYSIENKAVSFSSPAIVNDLVYFGSSDGWLHALDAATGTIEAQFQTDGSKQNGPRYTDASGRLKTRDMYPSRTLDGMIIGLNTMFTLGSILSSPVVADGVLYVGSTDGSLYALR
jgi:outer membrane protein assembly factor BamB